MRKVVFLSLVLVILFQGCAQEKKSPVEGIWKLISGYWYYNDTLTYQFPGNMDIYHIKIFSDKNFTYVGHLRLDTLIQTGSVVPLSRDTLTHDNYGGGTFTLKGDRYEENVLYAGKAILGRKVKMILEVKNDTLIQKWPADEKWKLAEKYSIEKYIRLK
jgi:hypothetical protein